MRASRRRARFAGAATAAILLLATAACTSTSGGGGESDGRGGTVSVMGTWSGAEEDSFRAMVKPWEEKTGTKVEYTGTRDLPTQITSGIASGNLPDIAGIPGPGALKDWYAQGALKPLDFIDADAYKSATPAGFAELGEVDGRLAGVFTKAAVKGLIYYNTADWKGSAPATWDDLNQKAKEAAKGKMAEWCVGLESGAASGWPGTDWIEDILLRQSGPEVYDRLVSGKLPWTSPEVRRAFQTFGEVLDRSYGGSDFVVNTNFGRAAKPMFSRPPGCLLHHQGSFITDFFANESGAKPSQYDFFPFPDITDKYRGSVTGGGDLIGMFKDTPQARSLMKYLLTPEAQEIWVKRGGFVSANDGVPLDAYPDKASRKAAAVLRDAKVFRFDASDQLPASVSDAFNRAVVKFAQKPGDLDSILAGLDAARKDATKG